MKLYIGADHRGFSLKESLKRILESKGYDVFDCGATSLVPEDDAADYAAALAKTMVNTNDRGVLLCGSGQAMVMAVNKFPHIKGILGFNEEVVEQGRHHNNANVLCLPAEHITTKQAELLSDIFLRTPFSDLEKYQRRQEKIDNLPRT